MSDVVNFNESRAKTVGDSALWTPADLIQCVAREIADGTIKPTRMVVIYTEDRDGGGFELSSYRSNTDYPMELALLELEKQATIRRWTD